MTSAAPTPKIVLSGTAIDRDEHGQPERADRGGRRHPAPRGAEAVLERLAEHDDERQQQQQVRYSSATVRSDQVALRLTVMLRLQCATRPPSRRSATRMSSEIASSTTDSEAAACGASLSMSAKMTMLAICTLPTISTQRADLADRAGERQRGARQDRRSQRRQHDPPEGDAVGGAERRRRLLDLLVELDQHRLHRAHDERERHEQQRDDHRAPREGEVDAERAVGPVQREQRSARRRSSAARTAGRSAR